MTSVETTARTGGETVLALRKLDKRFGATHALKAVDLAFEQGEIHAIVGENGAGKSTLIKLLTGVHPRTSGEVLWRGAPVALATPHEAISLGINAVHQEVVLCPHLSVAANIFLGDEEMRGGLLDHKRMVRDGQKLLDDLGFFLPATAILSSLTIGQQQLVATARAERRGAKFLIFDEPTAYLTRQETAALFTLIRRLKANGVTIVYISHRLEEVFELCERVSVLRDGALVGTRRIDETNEAALIALMINRTIEQIYHKDAVPIGATILKTEALAGQGFHDVSVEVREGQIVGLYGLIGAGRSEFVQSVFGRHPATSGRIAWQGREVSIRSERKAMDLGIALAPESRRDQGLCRSRCRLQYQSADLRAAERGTADQSRPRVCRRGQADPRCADQNRLASGRSFQPLGRQSAKGRDRQMAQSRRQAIHLRRADRRCGRRNQSGNLPPARVPAQEGRRRHYDLVLPSGSVRTGRYAARLPPGRNRGQPRA
jgi:ribose transport system ATP-binding protein